MQTSFDSLTERITTAEDLLAALRKGQNQGVPLEIGLGELKIPCRLISAAEELKIVIKDRAFKAVF